MEFLHLSECMISKTDKTRRNLVNLFLIKHGLRLEESVDYTYALVDGEDIVATGSLDRNVVKCIAVDENYQGMGITNKVITHLLNKAYQSGINHLFIYTKPENLNIFLDLGFYKIEEIPNKVVLLENKKNGITSYVNSLEKAYVEGGLTSAIVVNCNPFTLGHQYLIERAAKESDLLYVFVVSEDRSDFPTDVRLRLVKEGTKHLKNVVVHETSNYLISSATFPSYFMKRDDEIAQTHASLDVHIFGKYFVPAFHIRRRYVGEETACLLTRRYNNTMKKILPIYGVEVMEVPRMEIEGEAISASRIRKLIREGNLEAVEKLVPSTTYAFFLQEEGQRIINKIQKLNSFN